MKNIAQQLSKDIATFYTSKNKIEVAPYFLW